MDSIPSNTIANQNLLCQPPPSCEINFLDSPNLSNLPYTKENIQIYANLYKIKLTKNHTFYQYSVHFEDNFEEYSSIFKRKVISRANKSLTEKFGLYIYTGESLYGTKKVSDVVNEIIIYKSFKYSILIKPTKEIVQLSVNDESMIRLMKDNKEIKSIFEIMIKDILKHNPTLKYFKNIYGRKNSKIKAPATEDYNNINIIPGFLTRVMLVESGLFLNVGIKNKIISSNDCYYLIKTFYLSKKSPTPQEIKDINDFFKDKIIETSHTGQKYQIDYISFDKKAKKFEIPFDGTTIVLTKFYKKIFGIEIDPESPLISVKVKGKNEQSRGIYFPPQVCHLVGLTEEMLNDKNLMKKIVNEIKVPPSEKIKNFNDILTVINEKTPIIKKKKVDNKTVEIKLKSSFEKKAEYGLEIFDVSKDKVFNGSIMDYPKLTGKNNTPINITRPFKVSESKGINFVCVYHPENKRYVKTMDELINQCKSSYNIMISKSDYKQVNSENSADWIKEIEKYKDKCNVIIVLIDEYLQGLGIYNDIKKYSLQTKGYLTQFIVCNSLYGKKAMSIMSNILIQINTKIGGTSYRVDFGKEINESNFMIVGIDSSYFFENGKRKINVAICSTMNKYFTEYTNQKECLNEEYSHDFCLPIKKYLFTALSEYFSKNKRFPKGIIIYRQGVSQEQKKILKGEIEEINNLIDGTGSELSGLKIPYYYILVNKKNNLKFFSASSNAGKNNRSDEFENPEEGLLVFKSIVDPSIFEFYIQPQRVTSGTATPTNFHVAFGTLNCPKLIPKLTYDLCFLYSNWRGPVRVPAPLKYAEKLAKVSPIINSKLKNSLSFI